MKNRQTYFRCVHCGKMTAGRMPVSGKYKGDTSARFPRRHKLRNGEDCPGNIIEAEWIDK